MFQFKDKFLPRVPIWTRIDLLTDTGLVFYLSIQIFGRKSKPVALSRSTLVQTLTQVTGVTEYFDLPETPVPGPTFEEKVGPLIHLILHLIFPLNIKSATYFYVFEYKK